MKTTIALLILYFIVFVAQAAPTANDYEDKHSAMLNKAITLLNEGDSKEAIIEYLNPIILYYEDNINNDDIRIFTSRSTKETIHYLTTTETNQRSKVISHLWSLAHYYKGFSLFELGQINDAKLWINKAIELSPVNSNYLYELAYIYQQEKDYENALDFFIKAENAANEYSPDKLKEAELTRAMRGTGYCLIELGRLDEAENKFKKALQINASDEQSLRELKYIKNLRKMTIDDR